MPKSRSHISSEEEEEEEYEVEQIVSKRTNDEGEVEYFVKWVGYPSKDNTWQTLDSMNCPALIKDFEAKHQGRSAKSSSPSPKQSKRRRNITIPETQEEEKATRASSKMKLQSLLRSPRKSPIRSPNSTPGAGVSIHRSPASQFKAVDSGDEESSSDYDTGKSNLIADARLLDDLYGGREGDWEDSVDKVITIYPESEKIPQKTICLRFKGDQKVLVPLDTAYRKCPLKVLHFYESRLKFPSKSS